MNPAETDQIIHTNCAYYRGSAPCVFHKRDGRPCPGCPDYTALGVKILIVKLDAMGDVLRTTAILPALHQKYPGSQVTWVTRERSRALLAGNPRVHRVLAVEGNYLETLLAETFGVGIGLDADELSAKILTLSKCGEKLGFVAGRFGQAEIASPEAGLWWHMGVNDRLKQANRRTYQDLMYEICRLPHPVALPELPRKLLNDVWLRERRAQLNLAPGQRVIGLNTGGGGRWQCKKWTVPGYVDLVQRLRRQVPEAALLLYGGPEEGEFNAAILAQTEGCLTDLGCGNSLSEFVSLVSLVDVFFTPDSLGFHIAVALEKRTVVLVGPTSPWELDVYGRGEILTADSACAACYRGRCERKPTCMEALDPGVVETAILKQWNQIN
jgi:ADP-heptose:LPS heptosyltransferase